MRFLSLKFTVPLLSVGALFLCFFWRSQKIKFGEKPKGISESSVKNGTNPNVSPQIMQNTNDVSLKKRLPTKNTLNRDVFEDRGKREKLKGTIIDAGDYLDEEARRNAFAKSGADTIENLVRAVAILGAPYPKQYGRESAEQKVLALHFMGLSRHLGMDPCLETLQNLVANYQSAFEERIKKAVLWDVLGTAKICSRIDAMALWRFKKTLNSAPLIGQINIALKVEGFNQEPL